MGGPTIEAVFLDRDGVINEEVDLLYRPDQLKLIPGSSRAIKTLNDENVKVIIVTNQSVVARNMCSEMQLQDIHLRLTEMLNKEGAHIDGIYYCPHHPDSGYPEENLKYKIDCDCRKPSVGLLEEAISEHHLNARKTLIVGDTTTDIMTGINAGIETCLVNTGYRGNDGKFSCKPNFRFENLFEVADFVRMYNQRSSNIQTLILAGGKGERLKQITGEKPKPMIDLFGKPLMEHTIELLRDQGLCDIVISTGYGAQHIIDYFRDGNSFGANINYSHEKEPLGTGGAVRLALNILPEVFVLTFGDLLQKMDIPKMIRQHLYKGSCITLAVHQSDHPEDSDVIVMDEESIITNIYHKPGSNVHGNLTNAGIYVVNKSFVKHFMDGEMFAFDRDLLPRAIRFRKVFGYKTNEYIKDIGTPKRYREVLEE